MTQCVIIDTKDTKDSRLAEKCSKQVVASEVKHTKCKKLSCAGEPKHMEGFALICSVFGQVFYNCFHNKVRKLIS